MSIYAARCQVMFKAHRWVLKDLKPGGYATMSNLRAPFADLVIVTPLYVQAPARIDPWYTNPNRCLSPTWQSLDTEAGGDIVVSSALIEVGR